MLAAERQAKPCDVLIVGAGMAGIAAGIAGARMGLRVVLVEARSSAGGTAVSAFHRDLCGWFANTPDPPKIPLNGGLAVEFVDRMRLPPIGAVIRQIGRVHVLSVRPQTLQEVLHGWLREEKGLELWFETRCVGVTASHRRIRQVHLENGSKSWTVTAQMVIDASGDGAVITACGAARTEHPPGNRPFAGFSAWITGIRSGAELLPIRIPYVLSRAVASGTLPHFAKFTHFAPVEEAGGQGVSGTLKLSLPPEDFELHRAQRFARDIHAVLRENLPEYSESKIAALSPNILTRDGPLLRGRYALSESDVLNGRRFDDGVVRNAWPIEFWDQRRGPRLSYLEPDTYYEIPLRCLQAMDYDNVLAAGRCISVSNRALGSTRVTGPCFSLGEQAGLQAARQIVNPDE